MKNIIKLAVAVLAAAMLLPLASCNLQIIPGKPGSATEQDNISYTVDENGVLKITGSGELTSLDVDKTSVKEVYISDGITSIGNDVFSGMTAVRKVELPETLISIGEKAFAGCTSIDELEIPDSVKEIADSAFESWEEAQKIIAEWYEGSVSYWKEWHDFEEQFGEYAEKIQSGELSDELECKLDAWWKEWSDSEYWEKYAPTEEEKAALEEKAESWFEYWTLFGSYIKGETDEIPEENAGWWQRVRDSIEYLKNASSGIEITVPGSVKDFFEENKDTFDSILDMFEEYAKKAEQAANDAAESGFAGFEDFSGIFESFFGTPAGEN